MSTDKKRKSFLGSLLKIILIIVFVVIGLVVGLYLVLRFALGIDVIDIKKKIDLLNASVNETTLITEPYTNDDAVTGFFAIFGENDIYTFDGENYIFNNDEFTSSSLVSGQIFLTSQQLASCTNLFIKNFATNSLEVSGVTVGAELKQLAFSNFRAEDEKIKVDVNAILKFDLSYIKNEIKQSNNFLANIVLKYIPDNIYISSNADFIIDTANDNSYLVNPKTMKINNLTETQSQELLELFSKLYDEQENSLMNNITIQFMDMIFSCSDGGLLSTLNISNFTFELGENNRIYIVLN